MVNGHDDGGVGAPTEADVLEGARAAAAAVIAAGGSYREAAEVSGRSKRTIVRWAADPEFARAVGELRSERLSELTGRLGELVPRALDTIVECLDEESPFARLKAASTILEWTLRMRRASDLEVRIAEVERRQGVGAEVEPEAGYGSHGGDEVEGVAS